jgi:glycosyltransferase involved in cell wall biosynthesis
MRILVFVKNINENAAGTIFGKYIDTLSEYKDFKIDLVTNKKLNLNDNINKYFIVADKKEFSNKIIKLIVIFLKVNLRNLLWKNAVKKTLKQNIENSQYDLIISFVSGNNEAIAELGMYASEIFKAKFYIHMVDPIPAPKGWETYELYRKNLFFGIKKPLEYCNMVSLSNEVMTSYQMGLLKSNKNSFTLPNPVLSNDVKRIKRTEDKVFNYVFLGTVLTGARNPYKLFKAFQKIIKKYPNSNLYFFGDSPRIDLNQIPDEIKKRVVFKNYTKDLESVISITDVLIDIDGDLEYDVFISSKLQLYLSFDRPILSITGPESPTRKLLKYMNKSTLISSFDIQELADNLINVREFVINQEFIEERNAFLEKNHVSVLADLLYHKLKDISY